MWWSQVKDSDRPINKFEASHQLDNKPPSWKVTVVSLPHKEFDSFAGCFPDPKPEGTLVFGPIPSFCSAFSNWWQARIYFYFSSTTETRKNKNFIVWWWSGDPTSSARGYKNIGCRGNRTPAGCVESEHAFHYAIASRERGYLSR